MTRRKFYVNCYMYYSIYISQIRVSGRVKCSICMKVSISGESYLKHLEISYDWWWQRLEQIEKLED